MAGLYYSRKLPKKDSLTIEYCWSLRCDTCTTCFYQSYLYPTCISQTHLYVTCSFSYAPVFYLQLIRHTWIVPILAQTHCSYLHTCICLRHTCYQLSRFSPQVNTLYGGKTLLYASVARGDLDTSLLLLQHGADANRGSLYGEDWGTAWTMLQILQFSYFYTI